MSPFPRRAVYRVYDSQQRLLYIGMSYWPADRVEQHRLKPWGAEIATFTEQWFDDSSAASLAEVAAIKAEQPLHNSRHIVPRQMTYRTRALPDRRSLPRGRGKSEASA